MQSVVVATVAQTAPAPAATGSAQAAAGDASAPAAGSGGFAALLAAQMLAVGDIAPVPAGGDVTPETPLAGSGKSKTALADTTTDPTLAAMMPVPAALAAAVATPQAAPAKTDGAPVSGTNGAASQLAALVTDAKANSSAPATAKAPGGGFAALTTSLSDKAQGGAGKATVDASTAVVADPNATQGDNAETVQKVAEIAVGGNALPLAGETKSSDARGASAPVSDASQAPASSSIGTLQAGMVSTQGASAGDPGQRIQTPVGSPGWGDALGQKVVWMANGQQQSADLHLNPPNLGPMEVRLTVNNDQVSAVFVSHQPAVREAIEAAMPRLREMFAESGMTLGNAMVSSDSLPQQQQQSSGQQGRSSSGRQSAFDGSFAADGSGSGTIRGVIPLSSGGRGAVDLFA